MPKEFLHILVSAKMAVGVLSVTASQTAAAAAPPPAGNADVSAYEVFDAQAPAVAAFGDRGDGTGGGMVNC